MADAKAIINQIRTLKEQLTKADGTAKRGKKIQLELESKIFDLRNKLADKEKITKFEFGGVNLNTQDITRGLSSVELGLQATKDSLQEELRNVQEVFIDKMKVVADSIGSLKFPTTDFSSLEEAVKNIKIPEVPGFDFSLVTEEIKNMERILIRVEDKLRAMPDKQRLDSVSIAKGDIEALGAALSNIYIPQPPPTSPSFKDAAGSATRASVIRVSSVDAVPVVNPDGSNIGVLPSDIDITTNTNHIDKYYTSAGAVTDGIVWSPAAGKRWHITTLYIQVSAAAIVTLEDDLVGGDVVRWKAELAANSGVVLPYSPEHPFASAEDAADLIVTTSAGNIYIQVVGYEV